METLKKYSIDDVRNQIKGKTKPQQLYIIKQEKTNYGLHLTSTNGSSNIGYDENFELDLDELLKEIENDCSHKYDCDWNWFFNADNIPNQELIFATKDFLELKRKDEVDSLFIMNVLLRQMEELKAHLDKPVDFISKLKELPLNEIQRHILLGLMLRWYGGYPINNLNAKYDTILKLIEREFLNMFPDQFTPEKEFCTTDMNADKQMKEAASHINDQLNNQYSFTESKYIKKVIIDFEDLPQYIVQRGIVWKFESEQLNRDSDYLQWRNSLIEFLQTIPKNLIIKSLEKGIEYGKKVYQFHLVNECNNPNVCRFNQSWERRIAMAEEILNDQLEKESPRQTGKSKHKSNENDFTKYDIPVIQLSRPERLWMQEVYDKTKKGLKFTFREVWAKLHKELPVTFNPAALDERLISSNGEEIRLLGVVALEGAFEILVKINKVVFAIRDIILKDHTKRNITISEIAEGCSMTEHDISLSLQLIRDYGTFYTGTGFDADCTFFKSIDVGGSDAVYYSYIQFPGIEQLIVLKTYQSYAQIGEEFSFDEMTAVSQKLDTVLQELQTLKAGQEIIWTDLLNELNELKAHFSLSKKNWKQLYFGKIVDMVGSGIISETVSKRIAEIINPTLSKLLE